MPQWVLRHVDLRLRSATRLALRLRRSRAAGSWRRSTPRQGAHAARPALQRDHRSAGAGHARRLSRRLADRTPPWSRLNLTTERVRSCASQRTRRSMPAYISIPRADRVPDRRRPHGLRLLLSAAQPRLSRARGRAPPLLVMSHGGPTSAVDDTLQPAHPVLDQPRLRRAGRELRRQHRLRPRLPRAAERPVGHRRRRRLRQRRALPGRARRWPTPSGWRSAAAAPAATRRWAR